MGTTATQWRRRGGRARRRPSAVGGAKMEIVHETMRRPWLNNGGEEARGGRWAIALEKKNNASRGDDQ